MLTVITARAGDGKTGAVTDLIGKRMAQGLPSVLIVPDQITYAAERRLCKELDIEGFSLCRVMSFNRFCEAVLRSAGRRCPRRLSDSGRMMLLERAILTSKSELTVYRTACRKSGFAARMERMLALLKSCRISPEQLKEMCDAMPRSLLREKLSDTAVLYARCQELLGEDYCDNNDLFALAAESADCPLLKKSELFIDGFDTLTAQMLWLTERMLKHTDITVTLSYDESAPRLYSAQGRALEGLTQAAAAANVRMRRRELKKRVRGNDFDRLHMLYAITEAEKDGAGQGTEARADNAAQNGAAQNGAAQGADCKGGEDGEKAIDIFIASDTEAEMRHVAFEIREKLRAGARMRDFAVACCDPGLISLAQRIFSGFSMEVFCDTARSMPAQPAIQLIMSALKACRTDSCRDITDYLGNYLCPVERARSERLRELIFSVGLTSGELLGRCRRTSPEIQAAIEEFSADLAPLWQLRQSLEACTDAHAFACALWSFITDIGLPERTDALIARCIKEGMLAQADEYKQVWDNLVQQLEQLNMLLSGCPDCDADLLIAMLSKGFESQSCFVLPSTVDCITVGDPARSRFSGIKELYAVGAGDAFFPPAPSGEGLLSPRELARINSGEKLLTPDHEDSSLRSLYTLFSMLLTPEKLHLSYSRMNGRTQQQPGALLERIRTLCGITPAQADEQAEMLAYPDGVIESFSLSRSPGRAQLAAMAAVRLLRPDTDALLRDKQAGDVPSPENVRRLYGNVPVSMSRLETQAECPLKNLLTGGFRLSERVDFMSNLTDVGNVMHEALEHSVPELLEAAPEQRDVYAIVGKNLYAAAAHTHDGVMLHTARARLLCARLHKSVASACGRVLSDMNIFRPAAYEAAFGRGKNPPIMISTRAGEVALQGKIDRVDISADGTRLRIVDYKSSPHGITEKSIEKGTTLQLPLYMTAMESITGAQGAAMYYQNCFGTSAYYQGIYVKDGSADAMTPGVGVEKEQFRRLLSLAKDTAGALAADMLSGNTCARYEGGSFSHCGFCPHRGVCRGRLAPAADTSPDAEGGPDTPA